MNFNFLNDLNESQRQAVEYIDGASLVIAGAGSGPVVRDFIEKKFHVTYKQANVYNLMHSLGFSYQRTKGKYPEQDPIKREIAKTDIKKL